MGQKQSNQGMARNVGIMPSSEKAKDFKGAIKKLVKGYLSQFLPAIIAVLLCAIASTVFGIFGPKILGGATTELFEGLMRMVAGTGGIDFNAIGKIFLFLLCLYLLSSALMYLQGWVMSGVAVKISYKMREDISQKIDALPLSYFDRVSHGEVLSRMTNDVDTLTQTLNQSLSQILTNLTLMIGVFIMMLSISGFMTVVALAIVPVSVILVMLIVKRSQPLFKRQQKVLGSLNGHIEEMYGGHTVVSVFNGQQQSIETFSQLNEQLYESAWKSQFLSGMMMPLMNFTANLGYVGICVLGGFLSLRGAITVGDIQAFIQYVRQFTQPINQIANISNILQQTAAACERVFEFLEQPQETQEQAVTMDSQAIKGNVSFDHVKFGYSEEKIIIHDFSAKIKAGQKVAIVGPTGAGKTTIVKLLMRFYDVSGGGILLDGQDIRTFTREDLRSAFGMVLQDTWLYHDTIRENIRYGKLDATEQEIIKAAKAAQADHFIRTLPDGYDTILNEEASNVSQGQKQLLTIARTMLADPKILILDEATSSVDTRTEVAIQTAMDALTKGRTSFIIAHRLSTIRNADMILVMKDGDILETGNHETLLEKNGFYAQLYQSQFEQAAE